jgi:uncharacterized damage-inducible protein DinB
MKREEIVALVEFNAWANRRILGVVAALTPEQFTKELGSSFSSVKGTLIHIFGVEWVWLERLQGRSPAAIPDVKEFVELPKLAARYEEHEANLLRYVCNISQAELEEVMEYKTLSFGPGKNPRWQMIHHVVNHGTYHRGQVVALLRQLGAKGVGTDLITYYRERSIAAGA